MLGVGFTQEFSQEELRRGAEDGSIEQMLAWHAVSPGDFLYLPTGTVHAIGAGCTLVELQQNRGVTYRFYDYGRPRELHLDEALAVADCGPHDPALRRSVSEASECLVDGPFFRLDRVVGFASDEQRGAHAGPCMVLPLEEAVELDGLVVAPGQCAVSDGIGTLEAGTSPVLVCSPRG